MNRGRLALLVLVIVAALVVWRFLAPAGGDTVVVYVSHDHVSPL